MKPRREVERPFKDKKLLRVTESLSGEVRHGWLIMMTDAGGKTIGEWHFGFEKPEWMNENV